MHHFRQNLYILFKLGNGVIVFLPIKVVQGVTIRDYSSYLKPKGLYKLTTDADARWKKNYANITTYRYSSMLYLFMYTGGFYEFPMENNINI